ncbi:hypothetical protein J3R83DRAFT_6942 [Lanmaoa asiatica]|nr:hypothetical protein J3R83DRAFT_6942 [Lanmaoa asiatica]
MARATRSSATQLHNEKESQPDPPTSAKSKSSAKKRKRTSLADDDDHQPPKQLRSDTSIKEVIDDDNPNRQKLQNLQLAADVPIDPSHSHQILDILALIDSQALLDRVFPLPPSDLSEPSTSTSQSSSFSLRALLREPSQHPLRVLRAAVQNLFPISYHPRSRASSPAAQQLRFCNLACSLLDQASFHSVPLPLDIDTLLPDSPDASSTTEPKPTHRPEKHPLLLQPKKYALMQRLPFGTWWTSLNSDLVPSDSKPLKDLSTANAELVAILPSPSAPAPAEPDSVETSSVTLASYVPKKPPGYKPKLPGSRRVSCGTFLDYGPYSSFAPAFEQDGVEVGRSSMGELFWRWEDRKKRWANEHTLVTPQHSDQVVESPQSNGVDESDKVSVLDDEESLETLFSTEQINLLKQALGSLELEATVHELLNRNAKALKRLEELQNKRLSRPGEFSPVEQGSEEWDTAQGILNSLCLLTSLRPRSSTSDDVPLIPSPSALHKLQRTLPIAPTQGWHGTLPTEHTTALRDDSTLYIKSTATAIPAAPSAPPAHTPTPTQPAPAQATVATAAATAQAYAGYSYNYATPYRPGYQYKPGQPSPYYPNAYAAQTTAQAQAASQYYQAQPYSATGQQQYTYSSWYQYTPQMQSSTSAGGSRKGTPQPSAAAAVATPATTTPSTMPTSYAGFFSATTQTPGQRAVANTVAAATPGGKPYQSTAGGTWTAPVAPTLPPHMRSAVAGQPGVAAYNASLYQPNYYGSYQATPSPAQS